MADAAGDPDPFQQSFVALLAARALITATSLGLFDALAEAPAAPEALATRLDLDPLGVATLLSALRSLGYVEGAADGALRPSAVAARLLVRDAPESIATFVGALNLHHWELLAGLDDLLRGTAAPGWHERDAVDPRWESYVRGLYELSRGEHADNARLVPVARPRSLLDVGGAHGGFAMAMCRRHPELRATVLDLPASAAAGRDIVAGEGLSDRITFREGDVREVELEDGIDVIAAFNLVQHLTPAEVPALFRRLRLALSAQGCLVVGETERPEPGCQTSQIGALTGLLFYVMTGTRTYSCTEVTGWLEASGLPSVTLHRNPRSPWRVVYVARP